MPAMSAPEPSPSRMNSRICCTGHSLPGPGIGTAILRRRLQPAGRLYPVGLAASHAARVLEELDAVVAHAGRVGVLAAVERGGAERLRSGARLCLGQYRRRGQAKAFTGPQALGAPAL